LSGIGSVRARALSDGHDRLVSADEPLAGLQHRCGGQIPGTIAVPALLEIVRKARRYALRLARPVATNDGLETISAWVEVVPRTDGHDGCEIVLRNWQSAPLPPEDASLVQQRVAEIDRELSELTSRLDGRQCILTVDAEAGDLLAAASTMRDGVGRPWTDFVTIENLCDRPPVHWRLLDGASIIVPGSDRRWRAHLYPQAQPGEAPAGFELCLTSDDPPPGSAMAASFAQSPSYGNTSLIGREIAPVLRQPIARIIANAETIRTRLAGPLAEEYANYAGDIAGAGKHLLGLLEDLADLEVVEAEDFGTSPDPIDLAEVARQAAGILSVRALEKGIVVQVPGAGDKWPAFAEFRRVLQVLLNLLGNAIRYSPERSNINITLWGDERRARVTVADEGPGLDDAQQELVFVKFERLGRSGDGGSGLGLYISRQLARAMGGELSVESAPGTGARFTLEVPSTPLNSEFSGKPDHAEPKGS
jgi:anti-sigma regulatory factor (Ser/Thr protein kinase)